MRRTGRITIATALLLVLAGNISAALPDGLGGTFQGIATMYGGEWAFGVVDFSSGETETMNPGREFVMAIPHLPVTAMGIDLSNTGEVPLDEMIARNEYFWERLHWAQQGGRGMCMAVIWSVGGGRVDEWMSDNGFTGTEVNGVFLDFPDAPVFDPNYISVTDALGFLKMVYDNLDQEAVRNIGDNPPFSSHIEETLGFGNRVYGWMDLGEGSKHLFMIIDRPVGDDLGIVMLNSGLDDRSDADQAFRMLYQALED